MASDSKAKILREGERYVQQGKISQAINEYLKIAKDDPDDVLTHNTLGDLYLRQGKVAEANQIFLQVADNYARNNFLLKAIAVYKKILNSEPMNHEVSLKLAELCARQGLNVDARNLYLSLGDLCGREGKHSESLTAYEKAVEIDPLNAPVQLKLAAAYMAQDCTDKAYVHLVGAARAQMKKRDIGSAMASFRRALALNLGSSEALRGFLESALEADGLSGSLEEVKESIAAAPKDPSLRELLGRAYLAAGDLDRAEECFLTAFEDDDSRYMNFFALSKAFVDAGRLDRALGSLMRIESILISRRETQKLAESYYLILAADSEHLGTLEKLSDLLSGTNETQYKEVIERIVRIHRAAGRPAEALKALEKYLDVSPDSEKHLRDHRELFPLVFPDLPYQLPNAVLSARRDLHEESARPEAGETGHLDNAAPALVEIDLLLNYGMKEKALQLLQTLESKRPMDKEVRLRLLSLYREAGESRLGAEQSILLSSLYQKSGDAATAQKYLEDASELDPDWIQGGLDMNAFAREHGILLETAKPAMPAAASADSLEVDLSGDLSDIFFKGAQPAPAPIPDASAVPQETPVEEFPQSLLPTAHESVEDQLQEVDFYIRLGFQDEARSKLDQIASVYPGHLDLALRYAQLGVEPAGSALSQGQEPTKTIPAATGPVAEEHEPPDLAELLLNDMESVSLDLPPQDPGEADASGSLLQFEEIRYDQHSDFGLGDPHQQTKTRSVPDLSDRVASAPLPVLPEVAPAADDATDNSMFTDLISEMNSLTDQEIAREDFETHFHLGIAFREMGLIEDAIREFQTSMKILNPTKSPKEMIQCCGMLSTCFLEKGMSRSAIRWCQTGLKVQEISDHESIALRYDMGVAQAMAGDTAQALECFNAIFRMDPGYRDVAQKIDELKSGPRQHVP
jgi:tetratricopeptide (TPR) repeat protein